MVVDFWDTAGQERFASMHPSYYHKAHGSILVFDVTRKVTYQNLQSWYRELRQYCEHIPCICIANKIDVDYNVTSKAFAFPSKHNLPFYFVSGEHSRAGTPVHASAAHRPVHPHTRSPFPPCASRRAT